MSTQFIDFKLVKERASIHQVAQMLQLQMRPKGEQLRAPCPACKSGGDRAIVITPARNIYYCFSEKKGGDQIALAAHVLGISAREAAERIASHYGTDILPTPPKAEPTTPTPPQTGLKPLDYLLPAHESCVFLGIQEDAARALGIGFAPRGTMRGRVCVPIHSPDGTLLAYCGIAPDEKTQPKFLYPSNFDPTGTIWNIHRISEGDLFVCKDILQAILAYQSGLENVVAYLTESLKPVQLEQLAAVMDARHCESVELV
jgi:CHC2 zinc finger